MKKFEIFGNLINQIQEDKNTYDDKFKDYYKACHEINSVSRDSGFPFVSMDGKIYLYTGTHLEEVDDNELMMFLKFSYQKLSGDSVYCGKKELINGLTAQFPYTVMGLNVKQAEDKINFCNGTLDLKTGKLCKHNWADYFRYVLPYNYDKNAGCPVFMKYLNEVMPEMKAQDVLSEYVGWLFMPGLKLEKVLFLYGSGCNGKSVFVEIVEALLGKENISHESLSDLCGEYGANSRSNLAGKILNTCSDVAPNAFAGDLFKRIASGEPISAKILYKDVTTLTDYAKMMFCLNELPKTNDTSNGFYRRFLIAPFNVQIPKNKINPNLAKDIISHELPGIMNWVLEGRKRLIKNGAFTDSPVMSKALEEYKLMGSKKKKRFSFLLPPFNDR